MIPQLYFDFLRGAAAAPLAGVFRHNQMDLRGLAALAARMMHMLAEPEACDGDALELHGLSRLLRRRGQAKRARLLYERALAAGLPAELDRAARRELAALAKRERDYRRATELWKELADTSVAAAFAPACQDASYNAGRKTREGTHARPPRRGVATDADALEAYEQLAIYHEHHARQPQRAAELTRDALEALAAAHAGGGITHALHRRLRDRLTHRLTRLERKAASSLLASD
jgi:hypothetical protein